MRSLRLLVVGLGLGFGCSSSGPLQFTPVGERFSTAGTSGGMPNYSKVVTVRLTDFEQECPFSLVDGGNLLSISVNPTDGGALMPGTFTVAGGCAQSSACVAQGQYDATSGTVTLTALTVTTLSGSYDVQVPRNDGSSGTTELSGSFNASFCSE